MENESLEPSGLRLDARLKKIWGEYYGNLHNEVSPVYQKSVNKNVITFLSLNPSLPPEEMTKATRGENIHPPFDMIDSEGEPPNPFYDKYYQIGKTLKLESWNVLDLLYIRDSCQANIQSIYKSPNGASFINAQIELTLDILKKINPTIVIVSNKFAGQILFGNTIFKSAKMEEGNIFRWNNIPFIIRESGFMGSRRLWHSNSPISAGLKKKLYIEICRVLQYVLQQESDFCRIQKETCVQNARYEECVVFRRKEMKINNKIAVIKEISAEIENEVIG